MPTTQECAAIADQLITFTATERPQVIRFQLTQQQIDQLAPLVIDAGLNRQNVLFVASVVPFWSVEDQETFLDLQTVKLPSKIANKIVKLIRENSGS